MHQSEIEKAITNLQNRMEYHESRLNKALEIISGAVSGPPAVHIEAPPAPDAPAAPDATEGIQIFDAPAGASQEE